jgi:MFS superfamily sulfate permease-like transporter
VADPPVYQLGRKRGTRVFRPLSAENPDDETFTGLLMLRPVGRLFFLNGQRVGEKMRVLIEATEPRVVVLDMRAVFDVEYTTLKMLAEGHERMKERASRYGSGLTERAGGRAALAWQAVGQKHVLQMNVAVDLSGWRTTDRTTSRTPTGVISGH